MKLRLNLTTSPEPNNRPFLALAAFTGAIGLIALVLLAIASYRSWQANRDLRGQMAQVSAEIQRLKDDWRQTRASKR